MQRQRERRAGGSTTVESTAAVRLWHQHKQSTINQKSNCNSDGNCNDERDDDDDGNEDNGGNLPLPTPLTQPCWMLSVPPPSLLSAVSSTPLRGYNVILRRAMDAVLAATTAAAAALLPLLLPSCRCRHHAITAAVLLTPPSY